jgi:hypothetical protein
MKLSFASMLLSLVSLSGLATAQTPIGVFPAVLRESFDTTAQATTSFTGFPPVLGGPNLALISALQSGGIMIEGPNAQMCPPFLGIGSLFGRGTDVRIQFADPLIKFGGMFTRTNLQGAPALVTFQFFLNGSQVGNTMTVFLPPTTGPGNSNYIFAGFDLSTTPAGFYNEVRIFGSGGTFPGFVGIDECIAS